MLFEISKCDLAGRIGTLETNHGKVQTPAFVMTMSNPISFSFDAGMDCFTGWMTGTNAGV